MVILAGGVGSRVGLGIPKQLIKIAGRPIMEHTLAIAHGCDLIDEILVLMTTGHLDAVRTMVNKNDFTKVTAVLEGGADRNATTQIALAALGADECNVIFHDAVRPLVSQRILVDVVAALENYEAVDVAIPSADTIIQVSLEAGLSDDLTDLPVIKGVPPRAFLRRGQTPQAFHLSVIREAYKIAAGDKHFAATDDCTVVLRYLPGVPIGVVRGDERNMKVTEPIDIYIADKLFQLTQTDVAAPNSPSGYAEKLRGKSVVVLGGSYGIGADIAELAREYGANVSVFSRTLTNTHVNRRDDIVKARDAVMAKYGRIDFVVNTAGVLPRGLLTEASEESIYLATEVNYIAPILIAQTFHDELAKSQGALLLFTSSSYTRGRAGYSLYSSAKAATVNLTQALSDEWAQDKIRVNCINPERTGTPMRTRAFGNEPIGELLDSVAVARTSLDVLLANTTGHVVDVRRQDPLSQAFIDEDAELDLEVEPVHPL
ncbi:bifunctional cytidylyltransferase/SDR family oxidoreductase [Paenarthrobacter sp. Z7-10]|uniref:bifunctional cytidylyltransferase/SDR family oxidoreductase n=1 Tax=Paenarthrobacter sp. Z7-10 TaxID=2787635 RepID=UPI0022A93B05|nr:bifunctional cytidylyltransferase/SDR family oxidoreductase [Paenarthrobacter sp. Z7-10]